LTGSEKSEFDGEYRNRINEFYDNWNRQREKTVIHKISVDRREISYEGFGEIPGRVLNQFSMDEHRGYLRVATTVGFVSRSETGETGNNLYVLDEDMEIVGKVEGLDMFNNRTLK